MISKEIGKICNGDITKIENFAEAINDRNKTWVCHHRLEISPTGKIFTSNKLIELGLYFDQPPEALIFLTRAEHTELHKNARIKNNVGYKSKIRKPKVKHTKEELALIKAENTKHMWKKRKEEGWTFSEEAKEKMSKAHKGLEPWNKGKAGVQHHSEETKKRISEKLKGGNSTSWKKGQTAWNKGMPGHTKGKKRYTNGKIRIYAFECPEGFWEGWK